MLSRLPSLSLNQAALTPPKSIIPSLADAPGGGSTAGVNHEVRPSDFVEEMAVVLAERRQVQPVRVEGTRSVHVARRKFCVALVYGCSRHHVFSFLSCALLL